MRRSLSAPDTGSPAHRWQTADSRSSSTLGSVPSRIRTSTSSLQTHVRPWPALSTFFAHSLGHCPRDPNCDFWPGGQGTERSLRLLQFSNCIPRIAQPPTQPGRAGLPQGCMFVLISYRQAGGQHGNFLLWQGDRAFTNSEVAAGSARLKQLGTAPVRWSPTARQFLLSNPTR